MTNPLGSFTPLFNFITWVEAHGDSIPPPASAHETGNLVSSGTLTAKTKHVISAEFTGHGALAMDLTEMTQHSTPELRSLGQLTSASQTHLGSLSGQGTLAGSAVATTYQLTFGTPPASTVPVVPVFGMLPGKQQNLLTKMMWIGIDGSVWQLAGNYAGAQGLTLSPHASGLMHSPFKSIFSTGPYQIGAIYERTDYPQRDINIGVMVGIDYGGGDASALNTSNFRYRMLEQAWWRSWSPTQQGYFCIYTRTHGWRFLRAQLAEAPATPFELDPAAYDNNFMQWDMKITCTFPFFQKKMLTDSFSNTSATSISDTELLVLQALTGSGTLLSSNLVQPGVNIGQFTFNMFNNGDYPAWPKFFVSSPGIGWIQDGPGGNMLQLPNLTAETGPILVDTDPTARTITSVMDSNDPALYDIFSASGLLDLILNPVVAASTLTSTGTTLPLWSEFNNFFTTPMPPHTQSAIQVFHSDPTGVINIYVPQQFDKAYG
jgi:hypothetical protein